MMITLDFAAQKSDSSTRRALSDLSLSVAKCKKIVVVTGAGISCSSGIPDFRSSDGLYSLVKEKYPDVVLKGRDLFDASLFRDPTSTAVFHTFIAQLKQSIDAAEPGPTHHFIQLLDTKKKLLRSYTQNIDGFEARTGLLGSASHDAQTNGKGKSKIRTKEVRNVQLHGDIHRVRCRSCSAEYPCTQHHLDSFLEGLAPECPECLERAEARIARSARTIKVGSLRPAIVLYDEPHPLGDDIATIQSADLSRKPDMLIIMGTSLKVHGLKKLVKEFAKTVHSLAPSSPAKAKKWVGKVVFVNRTPPGAEWAGIIDYHVAGETDAWVEKVTEDWKKMRPVDWEVQQTLVATDGDVSMNGTFKVVASTKSKTKDTKDTKKKPRKDEENVPPLPTPMVLGTPNVILPLSKIASTPPLSPSKRRQTNSHYTVESSPSKRRTFSPMKGLEDSVRGLLFAPQAAGHDGDDPFDIADLSMSSPPKAKPPPKTRRTARVAPS
ncbi:DHS-like NAD/FAD-binding domain-containing protein [Mycena albidolilacea]|uniref:DHS-like NAD/FAD-binding domain-containing protein n=1 Tax=Mycena albidolilacea TaxID=1033008 RepID=A0AAD7EZY9_9AGAR|nr:DHS-like NAD/FAD-binding domain-containing protein [Mycena albidolilacea]